MDRIKELGRSNDTIGLLERGGKYENMWDEFKKEYKNQPIIREYHKSGICKPYKFIGKMMDEFEQKYFPKGEKEVTI